MSFKRELQTLINQYSKEQNSDTPDFILAKYLCDCLRAYEKATQRRDEFYDELDHSRVVSLPEYV